MIYQPAQKSCQLFQSPLIQQEAMNRESQVSLTRRSLGSKKSSVLLADKIALTRLYERGSSKRRTGLVLAQWYRYSHKFLFLPACLLGLSSHVYAVAPPANDNLANAINVTSFPYTHTVTETEGMAATVETNEVICNQNNSWWYKVTAPSAGDLTITSGDTNNLTCDIRLGIYTGTTHPLTTESCTDDDGGPAVNGETKTITVTAGMIYYIGMATGTSLSGTGAVCRTEMTFVSSVIAPIAPTGLTATVASPTQIDLTWTDNSSDETGFKIFRDTVELTPSPKVGANTTATATFSDTGLTCGTTYNYEVKATSAVGDSTGVTAGPTTTSACPIPQTITFTPPTSVTVGETVTLSVTGGASGNPVTFASTTPSVCTVSGTTLTPVSAGTCTVTADQAGNNNYSAASPVSKNILINEVVKTTAISTTPPLPNQMALFVQVDGTGSGSVSTDTGLVCTREDCLANPNGEVVCQKEACTDIIDTGTKVTLTPRADSGSVFTSWGGHEDCVDGEINNFGRLCIAFFQKIYDLTVIISGQGKVTGSNSINQPQGIECGEGGTDCSQSFSHGTTTYLQATPATGMSFLGWGGDCEGLRNPLAMKVVKEMKCEAQFGTVELPPVVVIPEPVVPLVPAEASTPTGEASTPAVPLVPAEASTPTGEASTPVVPLVPAEASTPVGTLVPAEASTPVGTLVPAEASTPVVPLIPAEASTPVVLIPAEASTPVVPLIPAEASTPVVPVETVNPSVVETLTPVTPAPVPVVPISAPILGGASSSCETTGSINQVCNYGGRPVTELEIQTQGMVSNGVLSSNLVNIGWVSNFTITVKGKLIGGVVTGYIKNFGVMLDFDFKGMSIIGGTLGGVITNTSKVGGFFQDVTLLAGTKITGGTLKGTIKGDKKSPAVLEKVRIKKGSKLSGVKLGKDVKLEKGVVVE